MQLTQPELVGFSSSRLARIAPAMQRHVQSGLVPGMVTLIARRGAVVHLEACGWANIAQSVPIGLDTVMRIYSMSKPVTTAAALMLMEEGALQLQDPISRYMPQFAQMQVCVGGTADDPILEPARSPITVRDLMRHTSGIVYGGENGSAVEQLYFRAGARLWEETIAQMADKLAVLPLNHHPGEGWHYGLSIDLLGRLIEVVSGQTLDAFMAERLFAPLGMADTGFSVPPAKRHRLAICYAPDGQGGLAPVKTPFDSGDAPAFLCGGGGLLSTIGDYARFCQMLLNGGELDGARVLAPNTVALMTANATPQKQIPVVPATWPFRLGYGMALGVRTLVDVPASGALGSAGTYTWQGAAGTDFWVDPQEQLYGLLFTQVLPGMYRPAEEFRTLTYSAMLG